MEPAGETEAPGDAGAMCSAINPALLPAVETEREITLDVTGTLPPDLRGTLYRNGPARWDAGGFVAQHNFDGDGLVSKFVIDNGHVRFQSRYVRTPKFAAEQAGRGGQVRGLGNQRPGGVVANAGRLPADNANTHAVVHADRLLALSDVGRPWRIDPDTLSTVGPCTFGGRLRGLSRFSAHPRLDPVTGEMFNFGLDLAPRPRLSPPLGLRCYRVDPRGQLHRDGLVALKHAYAQHDFAITERYYVFVLAPIIVEPWRVLAGLVTADQTMALRPELGTTIVLVPRHGGPHRVIECPPLMYIHLNNAYHAGADTIIDLVRYEDYDDFFGPARDFRRRESFDGFGGLLTRLRVTSGDRVLMEDLTDQRGEFPQHDWRRTGRTYRYGYLTTFAGDTTRPGTIIKIDYKRGDRREHTFSPGDIVGEPIFVPRSSTADEDDGWILTVVYLATEHRCALIILDARHPDRIPEAVARVDRHYFPGFHGSFVSH